MEDEAEIQAPFVCVCAFSFPEWNKKKQDFVAVPITDQDGFCNGINNITLVAAFLFCFVKHWNCNYKLSHEKMIRMKCLKDDKLYGLLLI